MEALKLDENRTYADYEKWELKDGERYELIDGVPYMMAAPSTRHQTVGGELFRQIANFLKGKPCRVFHAPFDVRLFGKGNMERTVVQPDVLVVCDSKKIDKKGCNGAPDFIIEIVSPSSGKMDMEIKLQKYRQAGVREYWIVDPESRAVMTFVLENGKYTAGDTDGKKMLPVAVLDGCEIDMDEAFNS